MRRQIREEVSTLQAERSTLAPIGVSSTGTILLVWYCLSRSLTPAQEFGLALAVLAFSFGPRRDYKSADRFQ